MGPDIINETFKHDPRTIDSQPKKNVGLGLHLKPIPKKNKTPIF